MALEMDPFAFLSADNWLSWWSLMTFLGLLSFGADSCTRGESKELESLPLHGTEAICVRPAALGELELEGM